MECWQQEERRYMQVREGGEEKKGEEGVIRTKSRGGLEKKKREANAEGEMCVNGWWNGMDGKWRSMFGRRAEFDQRVGGDGNRVCECDGIESRGR